MRSLLIQAAKNVTGLVHRETWKMEFIENYGSVTALVIHFADFMCVYILRFDPCAYSRSSLKRNWWNRCRWSKRRPFRPNSVKPIWRTMLPFWAIWMFWFRNVCSISPAASNRRPRIPTPSMIRCPVPKSSCSWLSAIANTRCYTSCLGEIICCIIIMGSFLSKFRVFMVKMCQNFQFLC